MLSFCPKNFLITLFCHPTEAEFVNNKELTVVPGPGHVNPDDKFTTKQWSPQKYSINTAEKHPKRMERRQPGPGYYEYTNTVGSKQKYGFGLRPFIDPFKCRTTTGPGDYNAKPLYRVKSGVISRRPNDKDIEVLRRIPGPSSYLEVRDKIHY